MGLPPGEAIPWAAWAGPYARFALALLLFFGILFALCGLLRRQWADRERLVFPLTQLPQEMVAGLGGPAVKPFLYDKVAWWGIGVCFAIHSWNALGDYTPLIPQLPMRNILNGYLTEPPWCAFMPVWTHLYPSVIGLSYLVSLEITFSIWFYWVVLKLGYLGAVQTGLGSWGGDFTNQGFFVDQGNGALYGLALGVFWLARSELKDSFLQAIGVRPADHDPGDVSPQVLWAALGLCCIGSVVWLMTFGIQPRYALLIVLLLIIAVTGLTRLSCEGGLFWMKMYAFPVHLVSAAATPSVLGATQFVRLTLWDRVMVGDWFRVLFMPTVMNSIHLASRTGLRRRSVFAGMAAAVVLALVVSFFSFLHTAYHNPGGAHDMSWYLSAFPNSIFPELSSRVSRINAFEEKQQQAAAAGTAIREQERPDVARRDYRQAFWFAFGAGFLWLSIIPHFRRERDGSFASDKQQEHRELPCDRFSRRIPYGLQLHGRAQRRS
jgi:hypothetical protein